MTSEQDRMARAGNYVLGLMNDADRERAERDLEIDPAFRDTMVRVAERMHLFDLTKPPKNVSEGMWKTIAERIAGLPQMQPAAGATGSGTATGGAAGRTQDRRPAVVVAGLVAIFAAGYAAGVMTAGLWP